MASATLARARARASSGISSDLIWRKYIAPGLERVYGRRQPRYPAPRWFCRWAATHGWPVSPDSSRIRHHGFRVVSSPGRRCRGRCSPRSCGTSIGCAARPCRRRDAAERGGRGIRGGSAPKGDERHRSSPIRPWSRIWWFSPTGIRLSTAPTALGRLRSAPDGRRLEHGHTAFGKCRLRTGASRVGPPHSVGSSGREKGGPRGR
jgi:hypothetical protein